MTDKPYPTAQALLRATLAASHALVGLEDALRAARTFISAERDVQLAGAANPGPDGQPDRSTIEPVDLPPVLAFDAALAAIDAALLAAGARP